MAYYIVWKMIKRNDEQIRGDAMGLCLPVLYVH